MSNFLDVKKAQDEITALLIANPELAEDEILRADMIEGNTSAHAVITELVRILNTAKAQAASLTGYIMELEFRRTRFERREQSIRAMIMKILNHANLKRCEVQEATVTIKAGSAKVIITDESKIPDEFFRIKKEPNKSMIREAMQNHHIVPGCELSNGEPVLSVTT